MCSKTAESVAMAASLRRRGGDILGPVDAPSSSAGAVKIRGHADNRRESMGASPRREETIMSVVTGDGQEVDPPPRHTRTFLLGLCAGAISSLVVLAIAVGHTPLTERTPEPLSSSEPRSSPGRLLSEVTPATAPPPGTLVPMASSSLPMGTVMATTSSPSPASSALSNRKRTRPDSLRAGDRAKKGATNRTSPKPAPATARD